jgi:hypothetical protein
MTNKWGKTETISSKSGIKQLCLLSPLLLNMVLEFLARVTSQEAEISVFN